MRRAIGIGLGLGLVAVCAGISSAHAEERVGSIELWTRTPGAYGGDRELARTRVVTVDLARTQSSQGALVDAQYGATRTYRYAFIEDLIRSYGPPADVDTALLHFANGMAIPLRFRVPEVMRRLHPAIARAIRLDEAWTSTFPEVSRTDAFYFDVRPTRFSGNKLVVSELWHPSLRAGTEATFSPWRLADTVTGIEFVNDRAFLRQLEPTDAVRDGARTYGEVCRFCHGARRQGAQFGWDFVEPIAITEYRKKDVGLYYHVKYRVVDAVARGLMMPALPFLTERDASDLLAWLKALAAQPLRPYKP